VLFRHTVFIIWLSFLSYSTWYIEPIERRPLHRAYLVDPLSSVENFFWKTMFQLRFVPPPLSWHFPISRFFIIQPDQPLLPPQSQSLATFLAIDHHHLLPLLPIGTYPDNSSQNPFHASSCATTISVPLSFGLPNSEMSCGSKSTISFQIWATCIRVSFQTIVYPYVLSLFLSSVQMYFLSPTYLRITAHGCQSFSRSIIQLHDSSQM